MKGRKVRGVGGPKRTKLHPRRSRERARGGPETMGPRRNRPLSAWNSGEVSLRSDGAPNRAGGLGLERSDWSRRLEPPIVLSPSHLLLVPRGTTSFLGCARSAALIPHTARSGVKDEGCAAHRRRGQTLTEETETELPSEQKAAQNRRVEGLEQASGALRAVVCAGRGQLVGERAACWAQ